MVPELGATSHAINDTDSTSLCQQFGQITHFLLMLCISTKYLFAVQGGNNAAC